MADKISSCPIPVYGGSTVSGLDADSNIINAHWEGLEFEIEDKTLTGIRTDRTDGSKVRLRIFRNTSSITLQKERLAAIVATAGKTTRVAGYTTTTAAKGYPIWAGHTNGVPTGHFGFLVVRGPALVSKSLANTASDVAVGDRLVAITAATSQSTTAGRFAAVAYGVTEQPLVDQLRNEIGEALSTALTNATSSSVLINVGASRHW